MNYVFTTVKGEKDAIEYFQGAHRKACGSCFVINHSETDMSLEVLDLTTILLPKTQDAPLYYLFVEANSIMQL